MSKPTIRAQWSDVGLQEVHRIEFLGCAITAYTDDRVWLDVAYWAEYLRDIDGLCAFCHGDPCGERSDPDSLIMREIAAHPPYSPFETCPCCLGRPT